MGGKMIGSGYYEINNNLQIRGKISSYIGSFRRKEMRPGESYNEIFKKIVETQQIIGETSR